MRSNGAEFGLGDDNIGASYSKSRYERSEKTNTRALSNPTTVDYSVVSVRYLRAKYILGRDVRNLFFQYSPFSTNERTLCFVGLVLPFTIPKACASASG